MTSKRAYAVVIRGGDDAMSRAIVDGIAKGRAARLEPYQREMVEDEIARQRAEARLARMDIRKGHDAEYWRERYVAAELAYGESCYYPTVWQKLREMLSCGWAMTWLTMLMLVTGRRL